MNEKEMTIQEVLNKTEELGFKRGVLTVIKDVLLTMEKAHVTSISMETIKVMYNDFLKVL